MRRIVTVLVAALAVPAAASAQSSNYQHTDTAVGPHAGDWEFTLSGSGTSNNDFDNHNIGVSGSIGKYLGESVLVGIRQNLTFADVPGSDDVITGATRAFIDYVFDLGRFRPYVGVSLGGIYGEGVNDTFAAGPEVGLKYYADRHTFIFAQTEYQFAFEDADEIDNAFDDGQFFHAIGVGMNF